MLLLPARPVSAPPRPPVFEWFPERDALGPSFAERSDWMVLDGDRRPPVSCILPACDQIGLLRALVPALAVALDDSGHPWEILVVDHGSRDGTFAAARHWSRNPGYRLGSSGTPCPRAVAVTEGLLRARGEVVLVIDVALRHAPALVRDCLAEWDEGARLMVASDRFAPHALMHENPDSMPAPLPGQPWTLRDFDIGLEGLLMLDRRIVDDVLR